MLVLVLELDFDFVLVGLRFRGRRRSVLLLQHVQEWRNRELCSDGDTEEETGEPDSGLWTLVLVSTVQTGSATL